MRVSGPGFFPFMYRSPRALADSPLMLSLKGNFLPCARPLEPPNSPTCSFPTHDHQRDETCRSRNRLRRRKMSKRHRPNSPSSSPTKTTRVTQTTKPFVCELPPTCSKHPTTLGSPSELESHYSTCHAHVCSAEGCNRIFPEPRFLDLVRSSSSTLALPHKLLTFTSTKQNVTIPLQI